MSKADAATKLVRWLSKKVEPTAYDLEMFGPNSTRVRQVLDFIPTISNDASDVMGSALVGSVENTALDLAREAAEIDAWTALQAFEKGQFVRNAERAAWNAVQNSAFTGTSGGGVRRPSWDYVDYYARQAAPVEAIVNLVKPNTYRLLTNPLAIARAYDVLQPRAPQNFLDVVRGLGERGLVQQPLDVLSARTLSSDSTREALLKIILDLVGDTGYSSANYGSLSELIKAARELS